MLTIEGDGEIPPVGNYKKTKEVIGNPRGCAIVSPSRNTIRFKVF
jgi:hypothetical protein